MIYLIAIIFSSFVFLDVFSVCPRIAGSIVNLNGLGYSFQVISNTIKRVLVVSYPPMLGYLTVFGDINDVVNAISLSYAAAMMMVAVSLYYKVVFVSFFCSALTSYNDNGRLYHSILSAFSGHKKWKLSAEAAIGGVSIFSFRFLFDKIFIMSLWIFFFYSSSMFIINLLSMKFSDYSSVILQLSGLVNAFGTLILALMLDPLLSRIYERGDDVAKASSAMFSAHFFNIFLISPVFFALFIFYLF